MRQTAFILAGLVSAASLGLVGCDVHKTQEGKVDLPKYEVSKTQEGSVQLPKYNVDAPKVDVGTEKKEVNVPKVGVYTEKQTVTVPKVQITAAKDRKSDDSSKK